MVRPSIVRTIITIDYDHKFGNKYKHYSIEEDINERS